MRTAALLSFFVIQLTISVAQAQAPAASAAKTRVSGVITAVDPSGKLTVKTDQGATQEVTFTAATRMSKAVLEGKTPKVVGKAQASELAIGDRVLLSGTPSEDQKLLAATNLVVMSKGDVAKKLEADQAEWQKRGVAGLVASINPDAKEFTVNVRSREGLKPMVVTMQDTASVKRYAPDSVKFSDAVPSKLAEVKAGDQVRVLGEKNEDGTKMTGEELIYGTFLNIAGTVLSVDAANNEIKLNNLDTKKPVTIKVNADSSVHRLPPFAAQMLAQQAHGGAAEGPGGPGGAAPGAGMQGAVRQAGQGGPPAGAGRPAGDGPGNGQMGANAMRPGGMPGGGPGGPGGMGGPGGPGRGNFDMQRMLERMPALQLSELKPGDALIVSSSKGSDPSRLTAITVLAGVEPILTAAPAGGARFQQMLGSWNLDGGGMAGMQ